MNPNLLSEIDIGVEELFRQGLPQLYLDAIQLAVENEAKEEEAKASALIFGDITKARKADPYFEKSDRYKGYNLLATYKRMLSFYTATKILIWRWYKRANNEDSYFSTRAAVRLREGSLWTDAREYKQRMLTVLAQIRERYPDVTYRDMNKLSLSELVGKYMSCHLIPEPSPSPFPSTNEIYLMGKRSMSGMTHLLSHLGPAVPATEHSVMVAGMPGTSKAALVEQIMSERANRNAQVLGWPGHAD